MTTWESDSIERIARLMAALDDPSADKAAVLAGAGFYCIEAWGYLQQAWLDRLVAEPKGEMARAFAVAYSAASGCALGEITVTPVPPTHGRIHGAADALADTGEMPLAPVTA